jgi:protein disulfide-isomerase
MNAFTKSLPIVCAALVASSAFAAKPDTDGARIGVWTQDYDAAVALAKTNNLPLMLNFTGSDWCGWCKLMDRQVFSTKEWEKWAKENIVLAFIDFPQKKSLVPKKYVDRNKDLSKKYGVRGYPTYIVIDPGTGKSIGQLGASREATPEKFISELEELLLQRPGVDLSKLLAPEDMKRLEQLRQEKAIVKAGIEEFGKKANAELGKLHKAIGEAKEKDAKAGAEAAFKARLAEFEKAFAPLQEKSEKLDSEISDLLKKARGK